METPLFSASVVNDQVNGDQENEQILKQDRELRQLFINDRNNATLNDLRVGLVPLHESGSDAPADSFVRSGLTDAEKRIPRLLEYWYDQYEAGPSVLNRSQFLAKFKDFTGSQLEGLNWSNAFCAGGSILACAKKDPADPQANGIHAAAETSFSGSDIDVFLYGIESDEEAAAKVREIVAIVGKNRGQEPLVVRTAHAVTIVGQYPQRHIQIVLRMYKSPAEVLLGFDVDSCTIGYDGSDVLATRRCRRSLNKRVNLVDLTRRSTTYEIRLRKYAQRGFAVMVPGLMLERVADFVYTNPVKIAKERPQGLAKLLALHYISDPRRASYENCESREVRRVDTGGEPHPAILPRRQRRAFVMAARWRSAPAARLPSNDLTSALVRVDTKARSTVHTGKCGRPRSADWSNKTSDESIFPKRAAEAVIRNASDYNNVALPWGPAWSRSKLEAFLRARDVAQTLAQRSKVAKNVESAEDEDQEKAAKPTKAAPHKHIALIGADSVFSGIPDECPVCKASPSNSSWGPLKFLRQNPGTQLMTGSFHPVDDDQYAEKAYALPGEKAAPALLFRQHVLTAQGVPVVIVQGEAEAQEQLAAMTEARTHKFDPSVFKIVSPPDEHPQLKPARQVSRAIIANSIAKIEKSNAEAAALRPYVTVRLLRKNEYIDDNNNNNKSMATAAISYPPVLLRLIKVTASLEELEKRGRQLLRIDATQKMRLSASSIADIKEGDTVEFFVENKSTETHISKPTNVVVGAFATAIATVGAAVASFTGSASTATTGNNNPPKVSFTVSVWPHAKNASPGVAVAALKTFSVSLASTATVRGLKWMIAHEIKLVGLGEVEIFDSESDKNDGKISSTFDKANDASPLVGVLGEQQQQQSSSSIDIHVKVQGVKDEALNKAINPPPETEEEKKNKTKRRR